MHDMTWILSQLVEARELSWAVPSFKLECFEMEIQNDPKPHLNWQEILYGWIWLTPKNSDMRRVEATKLQATNLELNDIVSIIE